MALATISEIEKRVGLDTYAVENEGIGGLLKVKISDFRVEEDFKRISLDPKGRFSVIEVTLKNWETNRFVNRISKELKISRNRIWFSGTKDKRAITSQLMIIDAPMHKIENIELNDVNISCIGRTHQKLKFGEHISNKFTVIVRGCAKQDGSPMSDDEALKNAKEIISDMEEKLGEGLFPNWIGPQRFGGLRAVTAEVGQKVIDEDFEGAVNTYLGMVSPFESEEVIEFRELWNNSKDIEACLEIIPKKLGFERNMLQKLKTTGDYLSAFKTLPNNLQLMTIHAVQSKVFNKYLASRIKSKLTLNRPLIGDIVGHINEKGNIDGKNIVLVEKDTLKRIERNCNLGRLAITGPLPGFENIIATGKIGKLEKEVIKKENFNENSWQIDKIPRLSSSGSRRAITSNYRNISIELCPKEVESEQSKKWDEGPKKGDRWNPEGAALKFKFSLPPGSYASILLREIMRSPINHY
ncbi:MAG: tRNA pseudouridine synthase D [Methanobacteriota archaeon]|nr:MAG: tRNA pseudouridine synthase D [Euryarchaeota archaeon]